MRSKASESKFEEDVNAEPELEELDMMRCNADNDYELEMMHCNAYKVSDELRH